MDFTTAVKHVLNNYANFSGRARRSEYWWWTLATVIFNVVANVLMTAMASMSNTLGLIFAIIVLVVSLGLIIPSIAVGARRLHDMGRSGWWLLISFVPLIGFLLLLYWFVQRGTVGSNEFGTDPYDA